MRLEKGDRIKMALSNHTTVLDIKGNQAVLLSSKQFVIVSRSFEWSGGRYADNLKKYFQYAKQQF